MSQEVGINRRRAAAFVAAYGRAWETWDFSGFVDLFTDDVVYVAHATEETVAGRVALADYIRKEAANQGQASVRMGSPVIDGDHVAAEFWVTRTNEGESWTTAGCFIARLGPWRAMHLLPRILVRRGGARQRLRGMGRVGDVAGER